MTLKKLELQQETLQNLTCPSESQTMDGKAKGITTFMPACETTGNCH